MLPRAATLTNTSLYLFVEDPAFFMLEPLLTAKVRVRIRVGLGLG